MRIAFTGSSGSGKTTMVKFVADQFNLEHISGSAGDVLSNGDKAYLRQTYGYDGGKGHLGVITESAKNPAYGLANQWLLQRRRAEIIKMNDNFVTDRSPIDNLTYFISQVGYHNGVDDREVEKFISACQDAWTYLTHVIYIKAVQPGAVENNGSRIANRYYQRAIDAQFQFWLDEVFRRTKGPKVLTIDFWDINQRKELITNFLNQE